jgi:hypothetical protein
LSPAQDSGEGHRSFGAQAFHYFQREHESVPLEPVAGPAAWLGSELAENRDWVFEFNAAQVAELEAACEQVPAERAAPGRMTRADFPLPGLSEAVQQWRDEITNGRGFVLLRGLPVERWGEARSSLAYWGLGLHLGFPGEQNPQGDLLGHVFDTGEEASNPNIRRYRTSGDIAYHCDLADVVCLLCLDVGAWGGASRIASSVAVYDELLRQRPDLAPRLFEPFLLDSRDEAKEGRAPYVPIPPCRFAGGRLRTFYHSDYFRSVVRHPEVSPFSAAELELLDLYEQIASSERFRLDMQFEPGDVQLVSNHSVLHARAAYRDDAAGGRRRHLLRLWLSLD